MKRQERNMKWREAKKEKERTDYVQREQQSASEHEKLVMQADETDGRQTKLHDSDEDEAEED
jgi:hypothetical protein